MSERPPARRAPLPRLGSRDLRLVVAIADHGSLRRAANALGQTVAAVSKHLLQLEGRLQVALFLRSPTGVAPTPEGVTLAEAGRGILADIAALEARMRSVPAPDGLISIGAGPFPAPVIAQSVTPLVQARWPAIRLEVQVGYPEDLVAGVAQGRLDLAVCHLDDIVLPPGLRDQVVQRLLPVCLVRQGHPLLAAKADQPVSGTSLAGCDMAGSRPSSRMLTWLESVLGQPPRMGFVSSDYDMVAEVLERSDMFAMMPVGVADGLRRHWPLKLLDVAMPPYVHEMHVLSRAPMQSGSAAAAVHAILCEVLARDETRQPEGDTRQARQD